MLPSRITRLLTALLGFTVVSLTMSAEPLSLGAKLPDVTVRADDGAEISLTKVGGEGLTFIYFYPKADTPGCTAQACSLRDAFAVLTEKDVRVFGVSMDTVAAQKAFREKYQLPFPLLADTEGAVVKAFGVPAMGSFAKRQAFLFKDGVLVWVDTSASTKEQAKDVLEALAKL